MIKVIIGIVVVTIIGATVVFMLLREVEKPEYVDVSIGDVTFTAELAANEARRAKGLGGRQSLGENEAMLFKFSGNGFHSFWMKDMVFPIDIIWIQDTVIVDIQKDAAIPISQDDSQIYTPENQANYVLEINAGLVERYGFKIGDLVVIQSR